jgi:hypothetical protein
VTPEGAALILLICRWAITSDVRRNDVRWISGNYSPLCDAVTRV